MFFGEVNLDLAPKYSISESCSDFFVEGRWKGQVGAETPETAHTYYDRQHGIKLTGADENVRNTQEVCKEVHN